MVLSGSVEPVVILYKILDKLSEISRRSPIIFDDHIFMSISVDSTGKELTLDKPVYIVSLIAEGCDIYVNFDRPITNDEYTVIWDRTSKIIGRRTSKIYAKTPAGLAGILRLEGLVLSA